MELYHVSFYGDGSSKHFYPRVPESAGDKENKNIARICFSTSVEKCIQAIGPSNRFLCMGATFFLYKFCTDMTSGNLITPQKLFQSGLVPDSLENEEYWYLSDLVLQPLRCKIMDCDGFCDIAWSCVKYEDVMQIIRDLLRLESAEFQNYIVPIITEEQTSEALYYRVVKCAEKFQAFAFIDNVWDEIAMLPWAQIYRINKINYVPLDSAMSCF